MALKNYAYYTNEQDLKIHISAILSNIIPPPSESANAQFIYGKKSYPADNYTANEDGSYTLTLTLDGNVWSPIDYPAGWEMVNK